MGGGRAVFRVICCVRARQQNKNDADKSKREEISRPETSGTTQQKAPAPSTLMALERTYLIGVIASYPIVLFSDRLHIFMATSSFNFDRMFLNLVFFVLQIGNGFHSLLFDDFAFAWNFWFPLVRYLLPGNILQGKRFLVHLWNGEVNFNNFVQGTWIWCQRLIPLCSSTSEFLLWGRCACTSQIRWSSICSAELDLS